MVNDSRWTGYESVPLGEATSSLDSRRRPVKSADRKSGPYPYWGASGVVDWVDDYIFEGMTLLVSEDGENLRTRKEPIVFLASGKYWVNNHAHVLLAKEGFDLRFLAYAVANTDIAGYLTGSTQPKLTAGNLAKIKIPGPPLNEQRRVAEVLGGLDDLIDTNVSLLQTAKELAKSLLLKALDEATEELPLPGLADVSRGLSYKGSGLSATGIPMVNMGSAENFGWLKRSGWKYYTGEYKPRHLATSGDVMVVNTEQTWRNEIIGWPLLIPSDVGSALFTHHVYRIAIRPGWEWMQLPLWAFLFSGPARAVLTGAVRGTTVANLPADALDRLRVPLLARDDHRIPAAASLLATAWDAELEVQRLANVRDELLPLLMSGRVRSGEAAV